DSAGNVLWEKPIPYGARGLFVTQDGHLVVTAIGDGTIRWYEADSGKELVAFFPHVDGQRWIAWTPSGYYMTSIGGDTLVGWQVNRGHSLAADFFSFGRFHGQYYRPDIVLKTFLLRDEGRAIREANSEAGRTAAVSPVTHSLPPVVEILDPHDGAVIKTPTIDVHYRLRSPSGEPIDQIIIRGDDHQLGTLEDLPPLDASGEVMGVFSIIVPPRDSELLFFARNRNLVSEPATIRLKWDG